MPFVRIWIHLVWSTKNRFPFMDGDLLRRVCRHIAENAASKNIHLDSINGSADHLHALILLGSDQTTAKIAQLLKGESSHWVNKENLRRLKFEWQDDYFAESVSWSALSSVRRYIADQEEHHRKKSFAEEFAEFSADIV
ncbi:MAG: IS200/IS605 family transposase [Ignavibacteriales bacterium]|nr:IS200/IS605 family transposase [Ignavibacteriales bacterium]